MPDPAGPRTLVAFDYGLKRIGVAAGNTLTRSANPVGTVAAHQGEPDWDAIARVLGDWKPALCIVGVPYNVDGTPGSLAARAQAFAAELGRRHGLAVEQVDELLSSRAAEAELRRQRQSGERARRVRKGDVDPLAACLLLEQWLNAQRS